MPRSKTREQAPSGLRIEPEAFLAAWRRIGDSRLTAEEAKAGLRAAASSAKTLGTDMVALKFVDKLAAMDRDKAAAALKAVIVYAHWLDLGIGDQQELFELNSYNPTAKVVAEHKDWTASQAGYAAGKDGEPKDNNPHTPGTSEFDRWVVGWHDGDETRREQIALGVIKPKQSSEGNPEDGDDE